MSILNNDISSMYPHTVSVASITAPRFTVTEETEFDGSKWFTISVHSNSLDAWLQKQCEENEEKCFEGSVPWSSMHYTSSYNLHESLFMYVSLKWS